ncbi:MFS transporter [uncultured Caulobacter sp.]|uniref:MFS transporter n=1 Tax=uncultured Caulobacter sp. TaxID=158749 RepID=UPI00261680ED|nr:MFS transporter [uncultured Caulobacter sp.]
MVRQIRFGNVLAYGATDMIGAGAIGVISGWLLYFYTTFCGLSAAEAASIFAISRLIDALSSPIVGHISDRWGQTALGRRFGRRRFFLLFSIPLLPIFTLMWVAGQHYAYYLATYIAFDLVYAFIVIPYESLAPAMTRDFTQKSRLSGVRLLFGQIATLLAGMLPGQLVALLGKENAQTFLIQGAIFSGVFMLAVFVTWVGTWESEALTEDAQAAPAGNPIVALYKNILSTLRIRAFRQHLGMYLAAYMSLDVFNIVFPYFVVFCLGGALVSTSNLVGLQSAAQFLGVLAAMALIGRLQPSPTYRWSVALWSVSLVALLAIFYVAPPHKWLWLGGLMVVAGLARGALAYIPWNLYTYMGDVDEAASGQRRDGALAGVMTFVRKAAQALAVMTVGLVLQSQGFIASAKIQSPHTQAAIVWTLFGMIGVLLVGGVWTASRMSLTRRSYALLQAEIERRRTAPQTPPDPEALRAISALIGRPYAPPTVVEPGR